MRFLKAKIYQKFACAEAKNHKIRLTINHDEIFGRAMKTMSEPDTSGLDSPRESERNGVMELIGYDLHAVPLMQGISLMKSRVLKLEDIQVIGSRLQTLSVSAEDPEKYVADVDPRFEHNLNFLRSMRKLKEVRDYVFYEIYSTQQWRGRYRSLEHFIDEEAGVTRGAFHKSVDKAEISISLLAAGIQVMPKVRQYEQLARVAKEHRVPAWKRALEVFAEAGDSEATTRYALLGYCHANGVQFGRMKFGRKVGALDLLAAKRKMCPVGRDSAESDTDWVNRIAPEVVSAISDSMPVGIRTRFEAVGLGQECGRHFLEAMQNLTNMHSTWDSEFQQMHRVLKHLSACEPAITEGVMRVALGAIFNFVTGETLLRAREGSGMKRKAV